MQITITRPDDWHLHLRDGEALASVVAHTAAQFGRAIVMPNLKPPVTTVEQAAAYRDRIVAALPAGASFEPLMTLYLTGIPADSRAAQGKSLDPALLSEAALTHIRALHEIASERGQSLAQMALAWALRDPRVTSVLVGASSVAQLEANVAAVDNLEFSAAQLQAIDAHAVESGSNLWKQSSGD